MKTLIFAGFFLSSTLWAWAGHYAVTAALLDRPELKAYLDAPVKVEPLEAFLKAEKSGLTQTFDGFYDWLAKRGSKRFKKVIFDEGNPTIVNFMRAARLYPNTKISYLHRVLPGEVVTVPVVGLPEISPHEKVDKNFVTTFRRMTESETTARAILSTYADEPDWELDYDLWSRPEYGYGVRPYGKVNDPTNGAAFHMQFAHENFVIRKLVPGIDEGMSSDRLELFVRLSRLAYSTNHPYWGARFAAWAFHYAQDMSQPYHAKAVPSESFGYYVNFALSSDKAKVVRDTTQLVSNRHLLYEDFVRGLLEKHYVKPESLNQKIYASLTEGDLDFPEISLTGTTDELFKKISTLSARAAFALDASVQATYGAHFTGDPTYDVDHDAQYDNQAIYLNPAPTEALVKQATLNLPVAAKGSRTVLALCRGKK